MKYLLDKKEISLFKITFVFTRTRFVMMLHSSKVLPVLLGLGDNKSLQLLDLGSHRLVLEDGPTQLVLQALVKNTSLRLLSLEGWTFRIEVSGREDRI